MLLYQLLRPLAYLSIRDRSKWKIDLLLPLIFAILFTLGFFYLPSAPSIFGNSGMLSLFVGLLQILPGFYLTALAAVATFNHPEMDQLMPTPAPTVSVSVGGRSQEIELTRRRMLSMLFGYLTFICFTIYFATVIAIIVAPGLKAILSVNLHVWATSTFLFLFAFCMGQLIFVTMFGLYQLSDRMHQPDVR